MRAGLHVLLFAGMRCGIGAVGFVRVIGGVYFCGYTSVAIPMELMDLQIHQKKHKSDPCIRLSTLGEDVCDLCDPSRTFGVFSIMTELKPLFKG